MDRYMDEYNNLIETNHWDTWQGVCYVGQMWRSKDMADEDVQLQYCNAFMVYMFLFSFHLHSVPFIITED